MSEEGIREYTEFKAPVTGWEVFLRSRYLILIGIIVILIIVFKPEIPSTIKYGATTFIGVFLITYWYLGLPEGFALDSLPLPDGHIGLKPLNRYQLERVTGQCIMVSSECGPVALVGHKLYAIDKEGVPTTHPQIEIQLNSEIAQKVAKIQSNMISEFLLLKFNSDLATMAKYKESYEAWRKMEKLDPENLNSEPKQRLQD